MVRRFVLFLLDRERKRTGVRIFLLTSVVVAALGPAAVARAQVELGTVEVEAPRQGDEAPAPDPDAVPFVTLVDARDPSAGVASVADLIDREVGVQIRSRGGLGAFSTLSLRGSDGNEVAIFIDGVPLDRAAAGTIDLSSLPVDGLDHVEIYRGVPPIELGAQAIGGAINLVTRRGSRKPTVRASLGAGSFGARSVSAGYGATLSGLRVSASAAYRGADNDFLYYDNGGTLLDTSDDHLQVRKNAGFDQLALDAEVGAGRRVAWRLGAHGFLRRQGTPGPAGTGAESTDAHLTSGRMLVDGEVTRHGRRADLRIAGDFAYQRYAFANPLGELVGGFGPVVSDSESLSGGLSGRVDVPWGTHQLVTFLAEARGEQRTPYDLLRPGRSGLPSSRGLGAVAIADEVRLDHDRLGLLPALRLDGAVSSLGRDPSGPAVPATTDWFLSPRLSVRFDVGRGLTLRGSAGRFVRFPTLLEQFGDGALLLGRPTLAPEAAWGGDLGASFAFGGRRGRVVLEGAFFGRRVSDLIAYVPDAYAATPVNIGDARVLGAEAQLHARLFGFVEAAVDYTFLDAVDQSGQPGSDGNQLPGRPRHKLDGRIELVRAPFRLYYALEWVDQVYRDPQNRNPIPGRVLHALGASFERGWFSFRVDVENLADLRVTAMPLGGSLHQGETTPYPLVDFFDYPLPGRSVYATVTLRH